MSYVTNVVVVNYWFWQKTLINFVNESITVWTRLECTNEKNMLLFVIVKLLNPNQLNWRQAIGTVIVPSTCGECSLVQVSSPVLM